MPSPLISTTRYVTTTADLTGNAYAAGQNVYLRKTDLLVTNNSSVAFSDATFGASGVIGTIRIAPDLTVSGSRMVIDLGLTAAEATASSAALQTALKLLTNAEEL